MKADALLRRFAAALLAIAFASGDGLAEEPRMNVLFLISDDLRNELGCYGSDLAKTPHLDALATRSVRFDRAYCQFPLCNPSRSSMLTGRRPTTVGVLGNRTWFGVSCPEAVSLPRHFKEQGYQTLRAGKIFHGGIDDVEAWTAGAQQRYFGEGATARPPVHRERGPDNRLLSKTELSDRWIVLPNDGEGSGDERIASRAIEYLRQADPDEPFFLACGFHKPHSPLEAPQRFYDLFDADSIPLPPDYAPRPTVPEGFPAGSIRPSNADLFVGRDSTPQTAREMIRAYLASTAWMDHNSGRVLDELERLGLDDRTIVVFWGDHGYQLGEKGKWSKAGSLWEQGVRVPLFIRDPRVAGNGQTCPRVVETLDLYPTLCELCGLPTPEGLEGRSLATFLKDPETPSDRPAYAVWSEDGEHVTGVAIRTERWRYAEFFGRGAGPMLTDPKTDPAEMVNLANDPRYAETVERLSKLANDYAKGWTPESSASAQ
ncbi:Choline-sulfatase [Botrimarina colliarenosi]|uniref:Choline-sulfatase n=1 Tax=Botrimarina colliarenosi TaxID=2528001 RepID=A0A5C6AN92_9BACT|nr:sulfatase [Botrimarina colliarenosi]TWU00576.1 Choline-sulfatase [Botrimarina colliarenosi]